MRFSEVKELLDLKSKQFNSSYFIGTDPIQIPHQFSKKEDIEIIGLLIALIAWGNRKSIITNGNKLVNIMGGEPHNFILDYDTRYLREFQFVHRTFNTIDLDFMLRALKEVYSKHGSLEHTFYPHSSYPGIKGRIVNFRETLLSVPHEKRTEKHLSNPLKKSAAKRINMYLRWMCRKDEHGVDFGIWSSIPTSELYLPLDVHTGNVARKLNLINRTQNDWETLEELMSKLRKMDPLDPVKYDFALFGLGAFDHF